MNFTFPPQFLWGAASASAQIEGGYNEDGKGLSIWDVAPADKIRSAENCHQACDHYHRFREDVALMKQLGLKAYRFSISWSRIQPAKGTINSTGLRFYQELVQELKNSGIEPIVTLYHWDMPVWVFENGGWYSEEIVELFNEYTKIVVEALSYQVQWWVTFNEPYSFLYNGNVTGIHAPFQQNWEHFTTLSVHCLRANAVAVQTIRQHAVLPPKIGIALGSQCSIPRSHTAQALSHSKQKTFQSPLGLLINSWWCDPMLLGKGVTLDDTHRISGQTAQTLKCRLDFIGLNIYQPFDDEVVDRDCPDPNKRTGLGWPIDAECMYWNVRFFFERYGLPILITENGMSDPDTLTPDGAVHDPRRTAYIKEHLHYLKKAAQDNIPILGYLHWSIMDNFEWAEGYTPRFGLLYVDYPSQKRIVKDSAFEYRTIIQTNGAYL